MRVCLALFLLMFSSTLFAQDGIIEKEGTTILSKVYENGEKDLFDKVKKDRMPQNETIEAHGFYKEKTNMYSNVSIGYTNFAISGGKTTLVDCAYNSNGFAVEYDYGIKPIKKIDLYFEVGLKTTYTFAKDVFVIYVDDLMVMDGSFRYFSVSIPLNVKYKFYMPNSCLMICPHAGWYYKRNVAAKQENSWSKIDFISGSVPSFDEDGVYVVRDYLKYQKNQIGWQVGLSLEYKNYNISGYFSRDFRSVVTSDNSIFNGYYGSQFGFSLGYRFAVTGY